jgi:3-phenylpropionate/trans-cinnamate dioxygenase ferredoxin reductase component
MANGVVIVGGGQAGLETAAALRMPAMNLPAYADSITLVCEELHPPYQRPPLSKAFLAGDQQADALPLRGPAYYETHHIDLVLGTRVTAINAAEKRVRLESAREVPYDYLVLAVGARNRPLAVPGSERALYLRTLDEAQALRDRIPQSNRVVVIGGGFIGLEVAAAARKYGKDVTVIEALPRLMARAVTPLVSDFFLHLHASHGVKVPLDTAVVEIQSDAVIVTSMGRGTERIPADLVVAGIGVLPNLELAQAAGLATANGIVVDEFLRTSDPCIFAVGDCADHPNPFASSYTGGRTRLESVQNAADQAKCVARRIISAVNEGTATGATATPYRDVPWFWTDQFEVRFQMAGLSAGHDQQVVRGSVAAGKFSVFHFKEGRLLAVDSVNRLGDHVSARKLLTKGLLTGRSAITPENAADESIDLKTLWI